MFQSFFREMPALFADPEIEHVGIDRGIIHDQRRLALSIAQKRGD